MRKSPLTSAGGFIPGAPRSEVSPGLAPTGVSTGVPGASGGRTGAGALGGKVGNCAALAGLAPADAAGCAESEMGRLPAPIKARTSKGTKGAVERAPGTPVFKCGRSIVPLALATTHFLPESPIRPAIRNYALTFWA